MNQHLNNSCDLHIHSVFSDSDAPLESIFEQAAQKHLKCIAITDHDTVEGIKPARSLSKHYGIQLIEGIELSAQHKDVEVHILGYFIDVDNKTLIRELEIIKALRRERLICMAEALNSLGIAVDTPELLASVSGTIPTRLHLALYLVERKQAVTLREVFSKYLAPGRPAYRARFKHSVQEVIRLIKECKGLAFLAHPHMISPSSWVDEFIGLGLDGLEIAYPSISLVKRSLYENLALKHGLLKSGGSDAHGSYKEFTQIGAIRVPYEWVTQMQARLERQ